MLQDEVYRISREVIRNAFAHAAAGRIEMEIRYDQDQLRLRIRDDGNGIDPKILEGRRTVRTLWYTRHARAGTVNWGATGFLERDGRRHRGAVDGSRGYGVRKAP